MILEIIQIIAGILFALFIPGFLLVLIFFDELPWVHKVTVSIFGSILITTIIGIILGYNEEAKEIFGGLTTVTIWQAEMILNAILLIIVLAKFLPKGIEHLKNRT